MTRHRRLKPFRETASKSQGAAFQIPKHRLATGEEALIPTGIVDQLLGGENPIRVWRDHRGLTGRALAEQAGIVPATLSQIETGKREGTVDTLKALAAALGVMVDDLV